MVRGASVAVLSVPPLLSALLFVFVAAETGWLPVGGMTSGGLTGMVWLTDLARHLAVPVLVHDKEVRVEMQGNRGELEIGSADYVIDPELRVLMVRPRNNR